MYDECEDSQDGAFLNLEYPLLWLDHTIVKELEHIIVGSLILLPVGDHEGGYQVIIVLLEQGVAEDLRIVDVDERLLLVHDVENLTEGYFLIVEEVLDILLIDDVVYEVLVIDAEDLLELD